MKAQTLLVLVLGAVPCFSQTGRPESQAEALAACSVVGSEPLTPYGFVKATLVSLWYARNGAERGHEIPQASRESNNTFSFLTAMMRITKTSTNDFLCAKRTLRPFAAKENEKNARIAADLMIVIYDAHISINERIIELLKTLERADQAEIMDRISTLQVERSQRWADLVLPTKMALMLMIDLKRTDVAGKTTRLVLTKAQKQALFDWISEHFPEFKNGTPEDRWSDPAKTAQMYFKVFEGRKCADE